MGKWYTGWWFGTMEFYDFPYIRNNDPNWLIFFRGVGIPPTSIPNYTINYIYPYVCYNLPLYPYVCVGFKHQTYGDITDDSWIIFMATRLFFQIWPWNIWDMTSKTSFKHLLIMIVSSCHLRCLRPGRKMPLQWVGLWGRVGWQKLLLQLQTDLMLCCRYLSYESIDKDGVYSKSCIVALRKNSYEVFMFCTKTCVMMHVPMSGGRKFA